MASDGKGLTGGLLLGNTLFEYKVENLRGEGFGRLEGRQAILKQGAVRVTPLAREDAIAHFPKARSIFQEHAFDPFNSIKNLR